MIQELYGGPLDGLEVDVTGIKKGQYLAVTLDSDEEYIHVYEKKKKKLKYVGFDSKEDYELEFFDKEAFQTGTLDDDPTDDDIFF